MDISLFDFNLPSSLIAQFPSERRDESRLMIVDRASQKIRHSIFRDIVNELDENSLLILNNSKVMNSRLKGERKGRGRCEVFVHKVLNSTEFLALLMPHKKFKEGDRILLDGGYELEILQLDRENISNRIRVLNDISIYDVMKEIGHIPLPPYIKRADIKEIDGNRYQTIYAEREGAVAAPTAGLHFTEDIFRSLSQRNI
ncbi:MAG: S-adenosylmethionine:tRNA ribosyltransferase-isomerase, partial [Myxococcota bacterium]